MRSVQGDTVERQLSGYAVLKGGQVLRVGGGDVDFIRFRDAARLSKDVELYAESLGELQGGQVHQARWILVYDTVLRDGNAVSPEPLGGVMVLDPVEVCLGQLKDEMVRVDIEALVAEMGRVILCPCACCVARPEKLIEIGPGPRPGLEPEGGARPGR